MKLRLIVASALLASLFGCGSGSGTENGGECVIHLSGALNDFVSCTVEFKDNIVTLMPLYPDAKPVAVLIASFDDAPVEGMTYDETNIPSLILAADEDDADDAAFVAMVGATMGKMYGELKLTVERVAGDGIPHGSFEGVLVCVGEGRCPANSEVDAHGTF